MNATAQTSTGSTTLHFDDTDLIRVLCGERDCHLRKITRDAGVRCRARGRDIVIEGPPGSVSRIRNLLQELYFVVESGYRLSGVDIDHALRMAGRPDPCSMRDVFLDTVVASARRQPITPKSYTQKRYVDAIRANDFVFGIGPAGTGKTYLAMAMAIASLLKKQVDRIILTRPAVEAGEKLGFLPGDLFEKVNPYLRPLYDALHDIMDFQKATELLHQGIIEVAPIAFMRGRTLNDSFVILDEAQNTSSEQMKMFLTRIGFNSRVVITGDVTQIDLPSGSVNGLIEARSLLAGVEGIAFVGFTEEDVVRHPLVQQIIKAYDAAPRPPRTP